VKLQPSDVKLFLRALRESFDDQAMALILMERFNLTYNVVVRPGQLWPNQALDIYSYFDQRNTTEQLVAAARDARPAVSEFAQVLDRLGFTKVSHGLEALLGRPESPYQDVETFRSDLSRLEGQVCRIACDLNGTGILIAADMVLTNLHVVVHALAQDGSLTSPVTCIFDDRKGAGPYHTPPKEVKAVRVLASSSHAPEDTRPGPMTTSTAFLDYALLKLASPVGDRPIVEGGEPRGYADTAPPASEPILHSGLVVLQHPQAQPMKIDIGAVTDKGPMRLRHSVNTEPGSSGAPVFDAALRFVALHHVGHANGPVAGDPGYNQAIPLQLILADARAKGAPV